MHSSIAEEFIRLNDQRLQVLIYAIHDLRCPKNMEFTKKIFKSIQQDDTISEPQKALQFCHHIEKVETIFKHMLKARFTLNVHSMSALLAMMQQKGV